MNTLEMIWRKTAARNRFQTRQMLKWWRSTGDENFREFARECLRDAKEAKRLADHYQKQQQAAQAGVRLLEAVR